jgi:hypothetical protein
MPLDYLFYSIENEQDQEIVESCLSEFIFSPISSNTSTEDSLTYLRSLPGGVEAIKKVPEPEYLLRITTFEIALDPSYIYWDVIFETLRCRCWIGYISWGIGEPFLSDQRYLRHYPDYVRSVMAVKGLMKRADTD